MKNIFKFVAAIRSGQQFHLYVTVIIITAFFAYMVGPRFLSLTNLASMAYQLPLLGLLSIGMMIAMLSGGINLSIVATSNFVGIMIALTLRALTDGNMGEASIPLIIIACLVGLAFTIVIGIFNGLLITKLNIPAILVTLGSMTLLRGISIVITGGRTISGFPSQLIFLGNGYILRTDYAAGIPVSIIILILVIIGVHFVLNRSSYGQKLYMVGANPKACRYSNVNVTKVIVLEHVLSAVCAYFTSLILIGQLNSVRADFAESFLLVAVLASFLGGVNPNGGFGKLSGVVLAAIILQLFSTGLNLMRVNPFMINAMWGGIIIIILVVRGLSADITNLLRKKGLKGGR